MSATKNLLGKKFGRLTVVAEVTVPGGIWHNRYLKCQCSCGRETAVRQDHLTRGKTLSCGCMARELSDAQRAGANAQHYAQLLDKSRQLAEQAREQAQSIRAAKAQQRRAWEAQRGAERLAKKQEKQQTKLNKVLATRAARETKRLERLSFIRSTSQERMHKMPGGTYEAMLAKQGGVCAICGKKFKKRLHIDHCHKAGHVRGLLCHYCNPGLGFFHDDIMLLAKAMKYLSDTAL